MSDVLISNAHVDDLSAARFGQSTYVERGGPGGPLHCSYCGSITPTQALALMRTPGTHYSGADWKYGYPHKFYIGQVKFYTKHMIDATTEQIKEWNEYVTPLLGVYLEFRGKEIYWRAQTDAANRYGDVPA